MKLRQCNEGVCITLIMMTMSGNDDNDGDDDNDASDKNGDNFVNDDNNDNDNNYESAYVKLSN